MKFPNPLNYVKPPPEESWHFLEGIEWFSSEGIAQNITDVNTMISSPKWEDFTLERRNDITASLAKNHRNKETEWNKVAVGYREHFEERIRPEIERRAKDVGLSEDAVHMVAWCVVAYMMEVTYESWRIPTFFHLVIESLKSGRIPCGWSDIYPEGKLIEY